MTKDEKPAFGRSYQTPFADRIRHEVAAAAGVAVIAVGAISSHDDVNSILLAGRADLCALGRTHLYDPQWTLHAAAEQEFRGAAAEWPLPFAAGRRKPPTARTDAVRPRLVAASRRPRPTSCPPTCAGRPGREAPVGPATRTAAPRRPRVGAVTAPRRASTAPRVEWMDTDAAGHHHNTAITRWVESAEAALMRERGLAGYFGVAPRVRHEVDFEARLWFGQEVTATVVVERIGTSLDDLRLRGVGRGVRGSAADAGGSGQVRHGARARRGGPARAVAR